MERKKKWKRIKNSHHTLIMYAFVPEMNKNLQLYTFVIGLLACYIISLRTHRVGMTMQSGTCWLI